MISGVLSQSVNDVFSATYNNYRIVCHINNTSAADGMNLRLRVSGADNSSNDYAVGMSYRQQGGAGVGNFSDGFTTSFALINDAANLKGDLSLDLYNPFTTNETKSTFTSNWHGYSPVEYYTNVGGGVFKSTTSFTGFTIFTSASTMTGTVRVYGYNN